MKSPYPLTSVYASHLLEQIGHSENKSVTLFSMLENEVRPAVIAAVTFSEKILQARPASCVEPFTEGENLCLFTDLA